MVDFLSFSHSWADQLVPVITSAQASLSDRMAAQNFSNPVHHKKLDPAAHLDPGPKGYNVYGAAGFSLNLVPKTYLDQHKVQKRRELLNELVQAGDGNERACQSVLLECRRLLQRYCAGARDHGPSMADTEPTNVADGDCLDEDNPTVPSLSKGQVSVLVTAYSKVLQMLQDVGNRDLTVQAMNELGDVMMLAGNVK